MTGLSNDSQAGSGVHQVDGGERVSLRSKQSLPLAIEIASGRPRRVPRPARPAVSLRSLAKVLVIRTTGCLCGLSDLRDERLFRNCALQTNRCALVAQTGDFP
jgi:hypothetical protein